MKNIDGVVPNTIIPAVHFHHMNKRLYKVNKKIVFSCQVP